MTNSSLLIVSRAEWNATKPQAELIDLEMPAERVVVIHTASQECRNLVLNLKKKKSLYK